MSVALTRARVFGVPWWRRAIAWFRGRGIQALALPQPSWPRPARPKFSVMLPPRDVLSVDIATAMHRVRAHSQHHTIYEFGGPPNPETRYIQQTIKATIDSLDRVCSACMAATSDETAALLHRGRRCEIYERSQRPPPTSMPGPLDSRKG